MSEWFEDWFASDFYLDVYKHRNDEDAAKFLDLILRQTSIDKFELILDAACGAGRHVIRLKKMGYRVVGFDLSLPLLKVASQNLADISDENPFFRADLRNVCVRSEFNLVLNIFTSFGYFDTDEENFSFLKNSINFLKDGGYFVFDYINKQHLQKSLVPQSSKKVDKYNIDEKRQIKDDRVIKDIRITSGERTHNFRESVKLYDSARLMEILESIGYTTVETYGNYEGDMFDQYNSERLIVICRK